MSDQGIRLIMQTALVLFLICSAVLVRAFVGPSKRRGEIVMLGTLGGLSAGVYVAYRLSPWLGFDVSVLSASIVMVLGWGVSWLFARRIPREAA